MIWKVDALKLDSMFVTSQGIYVRIKVNPDFQSWLFSTIYTSPNFSVRQKSLERTCRPSTLKKYGLVNGGRF